MAFTTSAPSQSEGMIDIYNIDWSVGQVGNNVRDDVMLVQALFRIFYYEMLGFNDNFDPPPGETKVIEVDGYAGPATRRHIIHFQTQGVKRGWNLKLDGIFDPFRQHGQRSLISRTFYAMDFLNANARNSCKLQGADNYTKLPHREDIPLLLRSALKTHKSTATKYFGDGSV